MKNKLKQIAEQMIREDGLINLSRAGLCERVGIPNGSFTHHAGCCFTEFVKDLPAGSTNYVSKKRTNPKMRKKQLLKLMGEYCKQNPDATRQELADHCGVSLSLINYYFGTMTQLRRAISRL